jgi:hypothetical protein
MNRIKEDKKKPNLCIFVDMANTDEPIYLACRRALVGGFENFPCLIFFCSGT